MINLISCFPCPRPMAVMDDIILTSMERGEGKAGIVLANVTVKVLCLGSLICKKGTDCQGQCW